MRFLLGLFLSLSLLQPCIARNLTLDDITSAAITVAGQMKVQIIIQHFTAGDAISAAWSGDDNLCHVFVSRQNYILLQQLMVESDPMPMLQGILAHEETHCNEWKHLYAENPHMQIMSFLPRPIETTERSELLADIVSIMYWRQYFPQDADRYIDKLLIERQRHMEDITHADYYQLRAALPTIPNKVDYDQAVKIRDTFD